MALLLLIGGGALALWGGPRLVPHLPAWASPAVPYLMTGANQSSNQIADLRSEIDARVGSVETALAGTRSEVTEAVDARLSSLGSTDGAEVEARLAAIETRLDDIQGLFDGLSTGLTDADGTPMTAAASAQLAANAAALEGVREEVATLTSRTGAMSQRIDEVAATAMQRVVEAEEQAAVVAQEAERTKQSIELDAKLTAISNALANGDAYDAPLAFVAANAAAPLPEALSASAETGVATIKELQSAFEPLSHSVIKSSIRESGEGTVGKLGSFLRSQVATRSLAPKEGNSVDAVLSRMNAQLAAGDLGAVLEEANNLDQFSGAYLSEWLKRVATRHDAVVAFGNLSAEFS